MSSNLVKTRRHNFSYLDPILYNGSKYPTSSMIVDGNEVPVFAGGNGKVYSMVNNTPQEVLYKHNLPEVEVYPSPEQVVRLNTIAPNDATTNYVNGLVNQHPVNSHLTLQGIRSGLNHQAWEKDHPNLAAWSYAASAAPFAVAAYPFAAGLGSAFAGTSAGQAALGTGARLLANPGVQAVGEGMGLGMAMHGVQDIQHGKFTPMTALDLAGIGPSLLKASKGTANFLRRALPRASRETTLPSTRVLSDIPGNNNITIEDVDLGLNNIPRNNHTIIEDVDLGLNGDFIDLPFTRSLTGIRTNQRYLPYNPETQYQREYIPAEAEIPQTAIDDIRVALFEEEAAPYDDLFYTGFNDPTPIDPWDEIAGYEKDLQSSPKTITVTSRGSDETPYTEEELRAFFNPDGTLKSNVEFTDKLHTGAHGADYRYSKVNDATTLLGKHLFSKQGGAGLKEGRSILRENPSFGKSGVLAATHDWDTSIDSTPLAFRFALNQMADRKFMPISTSSPVVQSNNWGINNYFKPGHGAEWSRARKLYGNHPKDFRGQYTPELLRDAEGNMTAFKLRDAEGEFLIPLRSRDEALDYISRPIRKFNAKFGTNYPDVTLDPAWEGRPWSFGTEFSVPNFSGIFYKKGGRLKNSLSTRL